MSRVFIRGLGAIEVSDEEAAKIKAIYQDASVLPDTVVEVGTWIGHKKDIRGVQVESEAKKNDSSEMIENIQADYLRDRDKFLRLTVDEKAKNLSFFNFFYWTFTKEKEPPQDVKDKAIGIQRQFFTEHPERMFCDPILFKPITHSTLRGLNLWQDSGLRLIERVVSEDMMMERRNTPNRVNLNDSVSLGADPTLIPF